MSDKLQTIAEITGYSRRHVQAVLHGYSHANGEKSLKLFEAVARDIDEANKRIINELKLKYRKL